MGGSRSGDVATEDVFNAEHPNPRTVSEVTGNALLEAGVNVSVVRLPQVHDPVKQGLVSPFIEISRAKGKVGYLGEGKNRWPAGHVLDVAKLYQLALDKGEAGARYHAVAEEGVAARDIAEVVAAGLGLPLVSLSQEEAMEHFGWLGMFVGLNMPASSAWTRQHLGWNPTGRGLIDDLKLMDYSAFSS
jgi:nucleoside-diphosphate-sugar epimerase